MKRLFLVAVTAALLPSCFGVPYPRNAVVSYNCHSGHHIAQRDYFKEHLYPPDYPNCELTVEHNHTLNWHCEEMWCDYGYGLEWEYTDCW